MKKLVRSVLMLSMASIAILSSCSKEDDNASVTDVKVTLVPSPTTPIEIGKTVTITVTATGNVDNKLKKISVIRSDGKTVLSQSLTGTTFTFPIIDTVGSLESYQYTAAVEGEKGSPASAACTVLTRAAYGSISSTPIAIDLNGQTQDSTDNYFMRLTPNYTPYDRGRQTFTANKANIDMCFYYGTANAATLASPDDATFMQTVYSYIDWTGAKKTKFAKTALTAAQFNDIKDDLTDSAIVNLATGITTWGAYVNKLAMDDVLIYQTAEGKKGLVLVAALSGSQASNAHISVQVVSQD
jgi:hypothetical protein